MHTGSLCVTSGMYRSECVCNRVVQVDRGAEAKRCPECEAVTSWTFLRGTYVAPTLAPAASEGGAERRDPSAPTSRAVYEAGV
jgi:hypothetical protein